jgi:uncharacterized protein YeaO (DUF488 family)
MTADIRVRRVYAGPEPGDGARVLVDRIWPRGLRKDAAHIDDWAKDVAPSTELRTWYQHDAGKFGEFRRRYTGELATPAGQAALGRLRGLAAAGPITLLTATRETDISQAVVLADILRQADGPKPAAAAAEGGEAACWAHLVCPECGAITSEGHRPGCQFAEAGRAGGLPG